jgi:hypothetical protein
MGGEDKPQSHVTPEELDEYREQLRNVDLFRFKGRPKVASTQDLDKLIDDMNKASQKEEDDRLKEEKRELLKLITLKQIETTRQELDKLRRKKENSDEINNLNFVLNDIWLHVPALQTLPGTNPAMATVLVENLLKPLLLREKSDYIGSSYAQLRPGFEEEIERSLRTLPTGTPVQMLLVVANHLKATGYLYIREG